MSKRSKVLLTVLTCLLLVAIAAYLLLPHLINSEMVKKRIVDAAKTSLNADLTFESFQIDTKTGHVSISSVRFLQDQPGSLLDLTCDKADMNIKVMPLLARKLHIQNLTIHSPEIKIALNQEDQTAKTTSPPETSDSTSSRSYKIAVKKMTIRNGRLDYSQSALNGEQAKASLGNLDYEVTDVTPQKLSRLVTAGTLSVSDVKLSRFRPKSNFQMSAEQMTIENAPRKTRHSVKKVDTLKLISPKIKYTTQRSPHKPASGTKEKIFNFIKAKIEDTKEDKPFLDIAKLKYNISDLIIDRGSLEYLVIDNHPGGDLFTATITNLDYHARNVGYAAFGNFIIDAEIQADILMGSEIHLSKKITDTERTFSLTNVDLAYIDRFFNQTDPINIDNGTLNIDCSARPNQQAKYQLNMTDFRLTQNQSSSADEFMFIPVSKILDGVNKKQGNLDIWLELDSEFDVSDDLESIANEFWNGMWKAILKSLTAEALQEGTDKLHLNEKAAEIKSLIEQTISDHRKPQ